MRRSLWFTWPPLARMTPPLRHTLNPEVDKSEANSATPHKANTSVTSQATPAGSTSSSSFSTWASCPRARSFSFCSSPAPRMRRVCRRLTSTRAAVAAMLALSMVSRTRSARVGAKSTASEFTGSSVSARAAACRRGR